MGQWHDGKHGTRVRVEDDIYTVSYPDRRAAEEGIAANRALGHVLLDVNDVGRVEVQFDIGAVLRGNHPVGK